MALGTFISGRYSATYAGPSGTPAAADVGLTKNGYSLEVSWSKKLINESDAYGESAIDGIHRGGNCFLQFDSLEYKAGSLNAAFPYGAVLAPTGAGALGPGVIGRLDSAVAGTMVLTATASTPAASTPATLTTAAAVIAENFPVKLLFDTSLREVPLRMRLYLYDSAGTKQWFATT